ncbi:MAG: SUMF1/EgtB/PvdO family nonheme iron enzyme [Microscillaceae bacterium]|nr:SUMF1/EgtB/PvdO family nonheme iron enzyme [Microscillaceae bacterium]
MCVSNRLCYGCRKIWLVYCPNRCVSFKKVKGATWKKPDGLNTVHSKKLPVTQVSYNDAMAYCEWSGLELPTYQQYWELIEPDKRQVISDNNAPISQADEVNVLGNVWDITKTVRGNEVRLAGGSLFCSPSTCHGTTKERELYVDTQTGNIHIGFAVIIK